MGKRYSILFRIVYSYSAWQESPRVRWFRYLSCFFFLFVSVPSIKRVSFPTRRYSEPKKYLQKMLKEKMAPTFQEFRNWRSVLKNTARTEKRMKTHGSLERQLNSLLFIDTIPFLVTQYPGLSGKSNHDWSLSSTKDVPKMNSTYVCFTACTVCLLFCFCW